MTVNTQFEPLEKFFQKHPAHGSVNSNTKIAKYTSFKCGGNAEIFADIYTLEGLKEIVTFCKKNTVALRILGFGTNVLVCDEGVSGVVIRLTGEPFMQCKQLSDNQFTVGARVSLQKIINATMKAGLSGCEWLAGIPASLGGAITMNAGAYGRAICDIIESITVMKPDGCVYTLDADQRHAGYRQGIAEPGEIVVSAILRFKPDSHEAIRERIDSISSERIKKIPPGHHAGCVFRNPPSVPAGKLLDELGCKGLSHGGACVSQQHANIIVNQHDALSSDIIALVDQLRACAQQKRDINLKLEITIWR